MKKLTFEECKDAHKRLWLWLSENPGKFKSDWPEFVWDMDTRFHYYSGEKIYGSCFACFYTNRDCKKCPINWGNNNGRIICDADKAEYGCWRRAHINRRHKSASYFAKKIANKEWTNKY